MVELYVKDVYYILNKEYGGVDIQEDDEDKLLEHVEEWVNKLDGADTIKSKRFILDVDGQDFPLVIMQGLLEKEPVNAFLGFKKYKEGVKLDFISYLDRDSNEILLEGRDMSNYVKSVCKTFGVELELKNKDKDKYLNEAKSYYIQQLNKVKKSIGEKFVIESDSTLYAEYHDEVEAPDEIDVGVSFVYDGENYHVNSTYFDGTGEEKKGVGFYFVHLKSNGEYNTDTEITSISKFKSELLKLHKSIKEESDLGNKKVEINRDNYKSLEKDILAQHKNWIEGLEDAPKGSELRYIVSWIGSSYDDYSRCAIQTEVYVEGKGYRYIQSDYTTIYEGEYKLIEVFISKSHKYNDIEMVYNFDDVWKEFYNIFPKKLYDNDSLIKKEDGVDGLRKKHNNWLRSQEGFENNTKTFLGSLEDLESNGFKLDYEDTEGIIVVGNLIKNSDLGHCIYTLYLPSDETGTYLRDVYIVDDYGTSKEVSQDDINQIWIKVKEDMLEKEWVYTEEKKQVIGRQINSYLRKLPNSNIKAEVEFNNIKQNKGEISAILNYNVWLNIDGKNKVIIKIDAKLDDNRKIKALRLKAVDKEGKEVVVSPDDCWNVVKSFIKGYKDDGFVEVEDTSKVKIYKGVITENNKKSSIKKISRLKQYLDVVKLPNILKDTDEFGKVLYVSFNSTNLKYYVSSGVVYDVYNSKIVVKKDDVSGLKDMVQEFYKYVKVQYYLKGDKNVDLGVKIFISLYLQSFDLRKINLEEEQIKNEFDKIKGSIFK